MADGDRLCQLSENLSRNGVEHSSTSGRAGPDDVAEDPSASNQRPPGADDAVGHGDEEVAVGVGPLEDGFFVEGGGPGIPEAIRPQVFDHGFTTRAGGSGFGLSVVRTIVGAHGWDVAASQSSAGGARFEMTGAGVLA